MVAMQFFERDPARISPTAHYTGYVWVRHHMSHRALATRLGRLFFYSLEPMMRVSDRLYGGLCLETMLLQRHRIIDHHLTKAIASGRIGQVVEVAAGLSPRGLSFARRYRDSGLTYVEADLPDMATTKRQRLDSAGLRGPNHHIVTVNLLEDDGPDSLTGSVGPLLRDDVGTALVTEGLVNYFDNGAVSGMWRRIQRFLGDYPAGLYLSDLVIEDELRDLAVMRFFLGALSLFAGGTHMPFVSATDAGETLRAAGFGEVALHQPKELAGEVDIPHLRGPDIVRVIEAWTP